MDCLNQRLSVIFFFQRTVNYLNQCLSAMFSAHCGLFKSVFVSRIFSLKGKRKTQIVKIFREYQKHNTIVKSFPAGKTEEKKKKRARRR